MNPEIKKRWVEALRSGRFKKGTGKLHWYREDTPDEFCCLGVLCEIAIEDGVVKRNLKELYNGYRFYSYTGLGTDAEDFLPGDVREWAELNINNPYYLARGEREDLLENRAYLSVMNDNEYTTFDEIADVIEQRF